MRLNKILKTLMLIVIAAFFLYIGFLGISQQEDTFLDISNYSISDCQETQNNNYSRHFTPLEKENYELICKRIENYQSGVYEFTEELTIEEFSKIWDAISLEKNYFYVYYPLILTKEDTFPQKNADGVSFEKIVIHFAIQEEWNQFGKTEEDKKLQIQEDEEFVKIVNLEDYANTYVQFSHYSIERYKDEKIRIEEKLDDFYKETKNMKGLQEKLDYYQEIFIKYFSYDNDAQRQYENSGFDGADEALYTRNIGCMLTGKGTCVGFAAVMKRLCEKDNMDVFIAIGEYRQEGGIIGHAWIGIQMKDGSTIYFDPTKTVSNKKAVRYYTKKQMQKYGYTFYE